MKQIGEIPETYAKVPGSPTFARRTPMLENLLSYTDSADGQWKVDSFATREAALAAAWRAVARLCIFSAIVGPGYQITSLHGMSRA